MSNTSLDLTIQGIEQLKASPETPKCPTCGKIKQEGEKCGCEVVKIQKVDYPADGFGIFTYLEGYKFPFPGFADQNIVDLNATTKRTLISSVKLFVSKPYVFTLPILVLFKRWAIRGYIHWMAGIYGVTYKEWGTSQAKYLPRDRFCKSARELLRVGEKFIGDDILYRQFLMGLIMTWEFDNAYRFRGQDIFGELNKDSLRKNTRKEIVRLIKLGLGRERLGDNGEKNSFSVDKKWKFLLKMASVVLLISPSITRFFESFFLELNVEEMKPTAGDWYYMSERWDYDYGGISYKERLAAKLAEDKEWIKMNPPQPKLELPQQPYLGIIPSESFWGLDRAEADRIVGNLIKNFMIEFENKKKQ